MIAGMDISAIFASLSRRGRDYFGFFAARDEAFSAALDDYHIDMRRRGR